MILSFLLQRERVKFLVKVTIAPLLFNVSVLLSHLNTERTCFLLTLLTNWLENFVSLFIVSLLMIRISDKLIFDSLICLLFLVPMFLVTLGQYCFEESTTLPFTEVYLQMLFSVDLHVVESQVRQEWYILLIQSCKMLLSNSLAVLLIHGQWKVFKSFTVVRSKFSVFRFLEWVIIYCMGFAVLLNALSLGWSPVSNMIICLMKSQMVFLRPGRIQQINKLNKAKWVGRNQYSLAKSVRPNIIVIMSDSLGRRPLFSNKGVKMAPHFHQRLLKQDNVFEFMHCRTVSGLSSIATTALFTGKIPLTKLARQNVSSHLLQTEMKYLGYETAMFSVYHTHYQMSLWTIMNDQLEQDIDLLFNPTTLNERTVNNFGMNDTVMVEKFLNFLNARNATSPPFFAMLILNHMHYPFFVPDHQKFQNNTEKYFGSMALYDAYLQTIFRGLHLNKLENSTAVFASADHGETPEKVSRMMKLSAPILSVPMWMKIPRNLISQKQANIIRTNQKKLVTVLDLYPNHS